jgi:hypothetical protein
MVTERIIRVPVFEAREQGKICSRKFKEDLHTLAHLGPSERTGLPGTSELIIFAIDEVNIAFMSR